MSGYPYLGLDSQMFLMTLIGFSYQWVMFNVIAGFGGGAFNSLFYVALTFALVGSAYILINPAMQKASVLIPYVVLVIFVLIFPRTSGLFFTEIPADRFSTPLLPLRMSNTGDAKAVAVNPANPPQALGDIIPIEDKVFEITGSTVVRGYAPQIFAIHVMSTLEQAMSEALCNEDGAGNCRSIFEENADRQAIREFLSEKVGNTPAMNRQAGIFKEYGCPASAAFTPVNSLGATRDELAKKYYTWQDYIKGNSKLELWAGDDLAARPGDATRYPFAVAIAIPAAEGGSQAITRTVEEPGFSSFFADAIFENPDVFPPATLAEDIYYQNLGADRNSLATTIAQDWHNAHLQAPAANGPVEPELKKLANLYRNCSTLRIPGAGLPVPITPTGCNLEGVVAPGEMSANVETMRAIFDHNDGALNRLPIKLALPSYSSAGGNGATDNPQFGETRSAIVGNCAQHHRFIENEALTLMGRVTDPSYANYLLNNCNGGFEADTFTVVGDGEWAAFSASANRIAQSIEDGLGTDAEKCEAMRGQLIGLMR